MGIPLLNLCGQVLVLIRRQADQQISLYQNTSEQETEPIESSSSKPGFCKHFLKVHIVLYCHCVVGRVLVSLEGWLGTYQSKTKDDQLQTASWAASCNLFA